jgi:hypothetical protein
MATGKAVPAAEVRAEPQTDPERAIIRASVVATVARVIGSAISIPRVRNRHDAGRS